MSDAATYARHERDLALIALITVIALKRRT